MVEFFGRESAQRLVAGGRSADLLVANNVVAHVADLNDFVEGIGIVLAETGVATIKPPHVLGQVERRRFDVQILPPNLEEEIAGQLAHAREWRAQAVVPIPEVQVL